MPNNSNKDMKNKLIYECAGLTTFNEEIAQRFSAIVNKEYSSVDIHQESDRELFYNDSKTHVIGVPKNVSLKDFLSMPMLSVDDRSAIELGLRCRLKFVEERLMANLPDDSRKFYIGEFKSTVNAINKMNDCAIIMKK